MKIANIRPSTLGGIKQLAKKISREHTILHTPALEKASRQAGFENFTHAKRQLAGATAPQRFPVFLSIHWYAPRPRKGESWPSGPRMGREILRVDLSRPLPEIVAKHRVGCGHSLHGFRMEYEDHLEHRTNVVERQSAARSSLLSAARSLRFMEATGLQPVSTQKYDAISLVLAKLPCHDHGSEWFDPVTKGYVYMDEPYAAAIEGNSSAERACWLEDNGLKMVMPDWEGIYSPGMCTPCLISPDGALLQRVSNALAKVQAITVLEPWPHETGMYDDDFVSPRRQMDAKPRRPRPGPSYREHNGASPYGGERGEPSRWRPTKAMPFELHQQLAPLMQKLTSVVYSWRVHKKLSSARSNLEDWLIREHKDQQGDNVHDLYYGGPRPVIRHTDAERLGMITAARAIVERGYEDCKPRRIVLAAFDAAIDEMEKRRAKSAAARLVA